MSGPGRSKGPRGHEALADIEAALEGLLGKLGGTLSDLVGKLETGEAGEIRRSATFDTGQGPVRAETGIRIRMAGQSLGGEKSAPAPVNRPSRKPKTGSAGPGPEPAPVREVAFDTYIDGARLIASVELPGVTIEDISLRVEAGQLALETTGPRHYRGTFELPPESDPDAMETVLRNGILEISFPIASEEETR